MSLVVLAWCFHTYFCNWGKDIRDIVEFWDYDFTVRTERMELTKNNEGINQILEPKGPHKRAHSSFGLGSADGVSKSTAIAYGVLLPLLMLWFAFFLYLGRQPKTRGEVIRGGWMTGSSSPITLSKRSTPTSTTRTR